jgi:outer membrane protein assembly factor BamA
MGIVLALILIAAAGAPAGPKGPARRVPQAPAEVVATIQVQGNTATPDAEILRMAGVSIGMPFDGTTIDAVTKRLRAAGTFDSVEVRKRFASLEDLNQIALVIIVDEGAVKLRMTGDPSNPTQVVRRKMPTIMPFPILSHEDGYGLTYGARLTIADPHWMGKRSRITFPLTWGGTRQAGVNLEKRIDEGVITRVTATAMVSRQENLAFDTNDDRARLSLHAEREFTPTFRIGSTGGWQRAAFEGVSDKFGQISGEAVLDTRTDPVLARNAVYARAEVERLQFGDSTLTHAVEPGGYSGYEGGGTRTSLEGRGYLGLIGQAVLAGRVLKLDSDRPLPPYLKPQLGGLSTLRGFPTGAFVGDTLVAMSAEVVLPLTSPLSIGKLGVTAFADAGTVYDKNQTFSDQTLEQGYGGSVWFAAAFLRLNIAVAHGRGASTRVHVGGNVTF